MQFCRSIISKVLLAQALSVMIIGQSNAQTSLEACKTLPKAMEANIASWKNIATKGQSIISEIDKLASNVNGVLRIEADLESMDKQLGDAKRLFDTFIPIVTPVTSIKNIFQLASSTLGNLRSKGVLPAKNIATKIATQSGIREFQRQLDQNVKPLISKTIDKANENAADVTTKLNLVISSCRIIGTASCVMNQSMSQLSDATNGGASAVNKVTSAQDLYFSRETKVNDGLKTANSALAFSGGLSSKIRRIKKPISDIAGSINKVGGLLEQKVRIKIATYDESFKLKDALKKVDQIINTVKKIPGVKDVEKLVNKPIEAVMDQVTKPVEAALKPLANAIEVPAVKLANLNVSNTPDFNPDGPSGLPNLVAIDAQLQPLLNACKG